MQWRYSSTRGKSYSEDAVAHDGCWPVLHRSCRRWAGGSALDAVARRLRPGGCGLATVACRLCPGSFAWQLRPGCCHLAALSRRLWAGGSGMAAVAWRLFGASRDWLCSVRRSIFRRGGHVLFRGGTRRGTVRFPHVLGDVILNPNIAHLWIRYLVSDQNSLA